MIRCGKDKNDLRSMQQKTVKKHSVMWRMFMSVTLESAGFMGKNYSDNWHSIKNSKDLTMKQMFDISEKLVSEQSDEIHGVKTIDWENGKIHENPRANTAWEERLAWFKSSPEYRNLDRLDGEPIEFEWNIFPGFTILQLSHKVQDLLLRLVETPDFFTGRIIFMSMFNDISWGSKDNKKECESNASIVSLFARRFGAGQWSFLGPCSGKKW